MRSLCADASSGIQVASYLSALGRVIEYRKRARGRTMLMMASLEGICVIREPRRA